ncbi:hypothetical protein K474DRAFT_344739 [Panus rudis PR-1116 ss-1]|nr:hypothetical protein K474DRAFT_344739 [Panus rudis PR-1116 ss-1]
MERRTECWRLAICWRCNGHGKNFMETARLHHNWHLCIPAATMDDDVCLALILSSGASRVGCLGAKRPSSFKLLQIPLPRNNIATYVLCCGYLLSTGYMNVYLPDSSDGRELEGGALGYRSSISSEPYYPIVKLLRILGIPGPWVRVWGLSDFI